MVLTSVATGRVAAIHDDGDSRVVTLAPVNLTDVIKNGAIDVDQALPASAVSYQLIPDLAWAQSDPASWRSAVGQHLAVRLQPHEAVHRRNGGATPKPAAAPGGTMPLASDSSARV